MSYSDGEALILIQIQATTNFSANNTSRGKMIILNSGKSKHYCILLPGPFEREQHSLGALGGGTMKYLTTWTTVAQVWVHVKKFGADTISMQARRQEIIDRFDAMRLAGDTTNTIQDVFVRSGGEINEMSLKNAPVFLMQELIIEWKEESNVTLLE